MQEESVKPNLFIIGLPRAGTTSTSYYLSQHPDIFVPPVKEPNYFGNKGKNKGQITFEEYLGLYKKQENKRYRMDGSVNYFFEDTVLDEIKAFNPDARIMLHLRDPLGWFKSWYILKTLHHTENASPDEAICRRRATTPHAMLPSHLYMNSCYYVDSYQAIPEAIRHMHSLFGEENTRIVFLDDIQKDVPRFCAETFAWLGVRPLGEDIDIDPEVKRGTHNLAEQVGMENALPQPLARYLYRCRNMPRNAWEYGLGMTMLQVKRLLQPLARHVIAIPETPQFALSPATLKMLHDELMPTLAEIEALTGRDLSGWREGLTRSVTCH